MASDPTPAEFRRVAEDVTRTSDWIGMLAADERTQRAEFRAVLSAAQTHGYEWAEELTRAAQLWPATQHGGRDDGESPPSLAPPSA